MGVGALRISPQAEGTAEVARIFRKRLKGEMTVEDADKALAGLAGDGLFCNGWYHGGAGMDFKVPEGVLT
jgi:hypothetical protein